MRLKDLYKKYLPTYLTLELPVRLATKAKKLGRVHFYFQAPIESVRYGIFGATAEDLNKDPFLSVVQSFKSVQTVATPLEDYFNKYNPKYVSDIIGFSDDGPICGAPANLIQYLAPWKENLSQVKNLDHEIERLYAMDSASRKCQEYGVILPKKNKQTQSVGPACKGLIECEYLRYFKTYQLMSTNGFINNHNGSGVIACHILQKNGRRVYHIVDGLHRSAVLIVWGCNEIPLSSRGQVVDFDNLYNLPAVKNGLISVEGAEMFFDFIYNKDFCVDLK